MIKNNKWQQLKRLKIFDSKFLKVYQDKVCLPNGDTHDYFLTKKSDIVIVVATTNNNDIVMIDEYKYAAKKYMTVLPAGHIEKDEKIIETAKRELAEETGYIGEKYEYLGRLYEAPVQDLHRVEIVRAKNVALKTTVLYENSEDIKIHLLSVKDLKNKISTNKIQSCSTLGALSLAGLI